MIWCQVTGKLWPSMERRVYHQVATIFHLVETLVPQRRPKMFGISLEVEQEHCPKVACFFLTTPCSSLDPLPFLISNRLNQFFGTQGRGHRKVLMPKSPTGSCLVSETGHPNWDPNKVEDLSSLPTLQLIFTEPPLWARNSHTQYLIFSSSQPHRFIHNLLVAHMVKCLPTMRETWVWSLSQQGPLEKGKATHSSIL